ncbi:glycosyltransferase family 2 protein, partial [Vibrio rumoiensis]
MSDNNLALAIPTYNRCDILAENLLNMMPELNRFNIPVYISDDSSNNETRDMISDFKKSYPYIYYYRNTPSLGHDDNCYKTLSLPNEKYIWYLGDSMIIKPGSVEAILKLIRNNSYDFIITNSENRGLSLKTGLLTDKNKVFSDLAWHLTLTGACIYSKDIIKKHKNIDYFKNFPQTSIILKSICQDCKLYYLNEFGTALNVKKVSYWNDNVFDVFAKDWVKFIRCIQKYCDENFDATEVIKSHSKNTGIFGVSNLINYRISGVLNFRKYTKY